MEPDSPSLLRRIRWGNVAWALAALVAIGLVLAWPHLQRRGPGLPDEAASTAPSASAPQATVPPAPPVSSIRPTTTRPPVPRRHPAPAARRRPARRPHVRHARRARRRARHPPPAPPPDGGASPAPTDTGPTAPAGDQEFVPG